MVIEWRLPTRYMKYTTKRTEDAFSASIDKWGDSYMQDATEQSLREVKKNERMWDMDVHAK